MCLSYSLIIMCKSIWQCVTSCSSTQHLRDIRLKGGWTSWVLIRHAVAVLLYLTKYSTYKCRVWALIDSGDTATHIASFTAPAYLVTLSYGVKTLDSFSIKLSNWFTYLPETQAQELFKQALAINMAIFTTYSTQAWFFNFSWIWSVQFGKTPLSGNWGATEFYRVMHAAWQARSTRLMLQLLPMTSTN